MASFILDSGPFWTKWTTAEYERLYLGLHDGKRLVIWNPEVGDEMPFHLLDREQIRALVRRLPEFLEQVKEGR
jgi:hypothetical protein